MAEHQNGRQRPARPFKSRSYVKAGQPCTKDYTTPDELVAVPKAALHATVKENKTSSEG